MVVRHAIGLRDSLGIVTIQPSTSGALSTTIYDQSNKDAKDIQIANQRSLDLDSQISFTWLYSKSPEALARLGCPTDAASHRQIFPSPRLRLAASKLRKMAQPKKRCYHGKQKPRSWPRYFNSSIESSTLDCVHQSWRKATCPSKSMHQAATMMHSPRICRNGVSRRKERRNGSKVPAACLSASRPNLPTDWT